MATYTRPIYLKVTNLAIIEADSMEEAEKKYDDGDYYEEQVDVFVDDHGKIELLEDDTQWKP